MKNEKLKKATLKTVKVMIDNAENGPSGFWTDDYEGCGNPKIFPEFDDGLKHGEYIHKEHYLCPWNTAVMYSNGKGNIHTGCYYSCSICDAKYLSSDMLKVILQRFYNRLKSGKYDELYNIVPLLDKDEIEYIRDQKLKEERRRKENYKKKLDENRRKVSKLLIKYKDEEEIKELIEHCYGVFCLRNEEELEKCRKEMFESVKCTRKGEI